MNEPYQDQNKVEIGDLSHEEKIEILWSRENYFSDGFMLNSDSFSDLTERSTSSCSWHNDDFDMKSSTKVTKSLAAIDDALYDKQLSPFISKEVFNECSNWSHKFPFLRLKGEKIISSADDSIIFCKADQNTNVFPNLSLHIEGKKLPIHTDKIGKKSSDSLFEAEQTNFPEEIFISDGNYKDSCCDIPKDILSTKTTQSKQLALDAEMTNSLNDMQAKIIEKISNRIWPKILEVLHKSSNPQKSDQVVKDFQLPPIVPSQIEYKQYIPTQRPRTEGTTSSLIDLPNLSTFLYVSPKVLQDRKDCKSGKSSLRSSRPSSEIHLSKRSDVSSFQSKNFSRKTSSLFRTPHNSRQGPFMSKKENKEEKDDAKNSLYLPALEEDINDPVDFLKELSVQSKSKTTSIITHFPNKPESFLPPIDTSDNYHPEVKLTRNILTFFESDIKDSSKKEIKAKTSSSRPNTCLSRNEFKLYDNINYKFLNDTFSSINNLHQNESRKVIDQSEKQVTLFPIVTSLVPSREKISSGIKKGSVNSYHGKKR